MLTSKSSDYSVKKKSQTSKMITKIVKHAKKSRASYTLTETDKQNEEHNEAVAIQLRRGVGNLNHDNITRTNC